MSGLEVIGVAASIIQVADLGTKLSVKLFSFYRQVKNANESIQLLSNEVALMSAILHELGDNLKEEESSKLCSDKAFETLNRVLDQCRDALGQIQRAVSHNDDPRQTSGRFQQVTGKFRLVLLEPNLYPLKANLERLKSTMLLLLNVIMLSGQIRSNNVSTLLQEQRDLIESLLKEKRNSGQMPSLSSKLSTLSAKNTTVFCSTDCAVKNNNQFTRQIEVNQEHQRPSSNSPLSIPQPVTADASADDETTPGLKEYTLLIKKIICEIDLCRCELEENRHSRIRSGVLNIHLAEIVRFQMEHNKQVDIDHSLFVEPISLCATLNSHPTETNSEQPGFRESEGDKPPEPESKVKHDIDDTASTKTMDSQAGPPSNHSRILTITLPDITSPQQKGYTPLPSTSSGNIQDAIRQHSTVQRRRVARLLELASKQLAVKATGHYGQESTHFPEVPGESFRNKDLASIQESYSAKFGYNEVEFEKIRNKRENEKRQEEEVIKETSKTTEIKVPRARQETQGDFVPQLIEEESAMQQSSPGPDSLPNSLEELLAQWTTLNAEEIQRVGLLAS